MTTTQRGQWAEQWAQKYLCQQGFISVDQNYRCRYGEIDLIMHNHQTLIFVEVRYRRHEVRAIESINFIKQQRLIKTADHFLQMHPWTQDWPCRFDAVLLSGSVSSPQLQWISNAF